MPKTKLLKKVKRILSIFVLILLSISLSSAPMTQAIYSGEVLTERNSIITPLGLAKPNYTWNWKDGTYHFSGEATQSDLYSNYYFTDAEKFRISIINNYSHSLTVKLLRSIPGIDFSASTETIPANESKTWEVNVTKSLKYCLKFYAACEFTGCIERIL
ncbi:MAG: hypothetical protein IKB94_01195 [Clostridia bacterium]|nr:hypothetical protein [Clostridia bacterium]